MFDFVPSFQIRFEPPRMIQKSIPDIRPMPMCIVNGNFSTFADEMLSKYQKRHHIVERKFATAKMIELLPKSTYAKNSPRKPLCGGESIIGGGGMVGVHQRTNRALVRCKYCRLQKPFTSSVSKWKHLKSFLS